MAQGIAVKDETLSLISVSKQKTPCLGLVSLHIFFINKSGFWTCLFFLQCVRYALWLPYHRDSVADLNVKHSVGQTFRLKGIAQW